MSTKTYRIFLASSAELQADRVAFENFINRKNKRLKDRNVFLSLEIWEDSGEAMSRTRSQDEYNKLLKACDLFVMLYWTKVGKYTREEYDLARTQFLSVGQPKKIYIYQRTTTPAKTPSAADNDSLAEFGTELRRIELFPSQYDSAEAQQQHFGDRLGDLFDDGTLEYGPTAECLRDAGKATVPDTFVGREKELLEIRQRLKSGGRLMLINAEGGMGKTTVAARYWDENLYQYGHNAWLFCEKGIVEEIKGLAPELGLDLSQLSDTQQVADIRTALNNLARENDCLLVLDNANNPEHIRAFQQQFGGLNWHILITSRCSSVVENEFPIMHLPPELAKKLFIDLYPHESGAEFDQLLDQFLRAVGYNTLAIEIFAKNLNKAAAYRHEKLADFMERLAKQGLMLGKEGSFKVKTGYLQAARKSDVGSDATTDQIIEALYDLTQLTEDERFWLVNLSLLPAVSHEAHLLGQLFDTDVADLCESHLEPLSQKGWLSTDTQSFRLSPVVQQIILAKNKETLEKDSIKLVHRLNFLLQTDGIFSVNLTYTQLQPYIEIGNSVSDLMLDISSERSQLYFNLGVCFQEIGLFDQAMSCFQKQGGIDQSLGEQKNVAISYAKLGTIYQAQGQFTEALDYFEKNNILSKDLYQANSQSESLKKGLASSYERLGGIYQAQGQFIEALSYFEQYNTLSKELYQADPRSKSLKHALAISYARVGGIYQAQGRLTEALDCFEQYHTLSEELYQANAQSEILKQGLAISNLKVCCTP